jgi:hypothetical protein
MEEVEAVDIQSSPPNNLDLDLDLLLLSLKFPNPPTRDMLDNVGEVL